MSKNKTMPQHTFRYNVCARAHGRACMLVLCNWDRGIQMSRRGFVFLSPWSLFLTQLYFPKHLWSNSQCITISKLSLITAFLWVGEVITFHSFITPDLGLSCFNLPRCCSYRYATTPIFMFLLQTFARTLKECYNKPKVKVHFVKG